MEIRAFGAWTVIALVLPATAAFGANGIHADASNDYCTRQGDGLAVDINRSTIVKKGTTTLNIHLGKEKNPGTNTETDIEAKTVSVTSENTSVATVSDKVTTSTDSKVLNSTVTGVEPGHSCIVVSNGNVKSYVYVKVIPQSFATAIGGGFSIFAKETKAYDIKLTPASIAPTPNPAVTTDTVNRIVQTETQNTPSALVGLAHFRVSQISDGWNWWLSLGAAQNSQGPVYGVSFSPTRSTSVFLTVGVRQVSTQELLPGFSVGQPVPSGITFAQTVKTPRLFLSISADPSALGCIFSSGTCDLIPK